MHRSGTSMIAQLLHQCGLDLGPAERLLKADATNPLGHFEHRGFLDIDRQLLKHFKATWREPPELQAGWHLDPGLKPLLSEAKALAATFDGRSPWGWKEPRASLFLPFWREAIPNMRFVICIRNPWRSRARWKREIIFRFVKGRLFGTAMCELHLRIQREAQEFSRSLKISFTMVPVKSRACLDFVGCQCPAGIQTSIVLSLPSCGIIPVRFELFWQNLV